MLCVRFLANHNMTYAFLNRHEGVEGLPDHVHVSSPCEHLGAKSSPSKPLPPMGTALRGLDTVYPNCSKTGSLSDDVSVRFELRICASVTKTTFRASSKPSPYDLGLPHEGCRICSGPTRTQGVLRAIHPPQKKKFPACIDFLSERPNEKPCRHFTDARNAPSRQQTPQQI